MALNISTELITADGFQLATSYGRVGVSDNIYGTHLQAVVEIYKDEDGFLAGNDPVKVNGFDFSLNEPYNRDTDGVDILSLAHTGLKAKLEAQGIDSTIVL